MNKTMDKKGSLSYVCINCGLKVNELYKTYSPTVLKLSTCENCGEISDKYIEYDPVLIMIDLVLLHKQAYRHFLYNTEFKNHFKLAILVQLMEAYADWVFHFPRNTDIKDDINTQEPFSRQNDLQFYMICLKILFSTVVYNITVYVLTMCLLKFSRRSLRDLDLLLILKTYTISSFGKFFLLPALIWSDHKGESLNILFVFIHTTLCQFLVYSVVCRFSMYWSVLVIVFSNSLRIISIDLFNSVFPNNNV